MSKDMLRIKIDDKMTKNLKGLDVKFGLEKSSGVDFKAKQKVGLQLINWVVNGSSSESVVPPIKDGILRGSGSVFVGSKMVGDTKGMFGNGNPNNSYSGKPDEITIGINTSYAAKLHEKQFSDTPQKGAWSPGPISRQSGDVGNKFVERHLKADGKNLTQLYGKFIKQGLKT